MDWQLLLPVQGWAHKGILKSQKAGPFKCVRPKRKASEKLWHSLFKELEKYKNIDEDELFGKLSEEKLKHLKNILDDLDPKSALLPAGFWQKDQTQKAATWTIDCEHLLMYLAKEALEQKDREHFVPFTGEKKVFIPNEKPVEMSEEDKVTLDPELEEGLANASDTELYNLITVLGEHNLLNNPKCDE